MPSPGGLVTARDIAQRGYVGLTEWPTGIRDIQAPVVTLAEIEHDVQPAIAGKPRMGVVPVLQQLNQESTLIFMCDLGGNPG